MAFRYRHDHPPSNLFGEHYQFLAARGGAAYTLSVNESLAKPRRSVLQLKTMLKDLLAGGGDAPMVPARPRSDAAAQQLVGATSGTGMTLTVRQVLDPTAHKLPDWQVHLGAPFRT